jgi:transcription elongation factor S-II
MSFRRQRVREKLCVLFDETSARKLERKIYNFAIRSAKRDDIPRYWECPAFAYRYSTKGLSILFNLTNVKNPELIRKVRDGHITFDKLVHATPYELFPEIWEESIERVVSKQLRRQLTCDVQSVADGAFTCGACKSKKTTYYQMQTRSADEPMTTFVQCLQCSRRWRC